LILVDFVNFGVDVIGVMTGMSVVREYVRDGKMTKMVIIELTDHRFVIWFK
jgi:hypothetical protein